MNFFLKNKKVNENLKLDNKNIIVCDFETIIINKIHYVYAIGIKYKVSNVIYEKYLFTKNNTQNELFFKESETLLCDFIQFLESLTYKKKGYVYFHNLRSFDGFFILSIISKYFISEKKKNILIRDNMIYKIVYKNIIFLDSLNIINDTLNNIAFEFLNKKKFLFNISKITQLCSIEKNYFYIKKYLKQDTNLLYDIIWLLLKKFDELFKLDLTQNITISSISYSIYKMYYLHKDFKIEILNKFRDTFVRKGYYGGLCCVLKTQMEEGYYYDINSLYPYVMCNNLYPLGKGVYIYFNKNMKYINSKYFGFIECLIYIPNTLTIPPLCFKNKNGRLIQAHGYIKGVWFTEEVNFAIELGCILIKVYKVLHYEEKKNIFNNFVLDLYSKRLNTKSFIEKRLYKNILNSLYGRFGIKVENNYIRWDKEKNDLYEYFSNIKRLLGINQEILEYTIDSDLYNESIHNIDLDESDLKEIKTFYKNVTFQMKMSSNSTHISAAISSYARIKLLKDIYYIINYYKHDLIIYYYDTDSIIMNKKMPNDMISQNDLGKYKLIDHIKRGIFLAPKTYYLDVQISDSFIRKWKGLEHHLKNNIDYNKYKLFLKKDYIDVFEDQYSPINKNINNLQIIEKIKTYTIHFENDKYEKIYDKNDVFIETKPFYIELNYWFN